MISVKVTGVAAAARDLRATPGALISIATESVNAAAEHANEFVVRRTSQQYNLSEATLSQYVSVRRASVRADSVSGSVTLQIAAVPLTEFGAQVRMVRYTGPDSRGRRYRSRLLPEVRVALYRGKAARKLPGAFPLRQRGSGALRGGEAVRKRVGAQRGRLTGFRYFTFPKRLTDRLLVEAQREIGTQFGVTFRVAYRKWIRGAAVLRDNN